MTNYELVSSLAFFLLEKTGTVLGNWQGRMTAKEQRTLFGRFLGKGTIIINGAEETIRHRIKVCFGLDWDDSAIICWAEI